MSALNDILKNINLDKITSDIQYENLPEGYYLCEVEKASWEISKSSQNEMIKWQLNIIEDGVSFNGETYKKEYVPNTKNRKIFIYHVLKDEKTVNKLLSDMLKFEDKDGNSIFDRKFFQTQEAIEACLDALIGKHIYVAINIDKNDNEWKRFISWKAASKLELV